jgi:TrmH family RNA methyltransferase
MITSSKNPKIQYIRTLIARGQTRTKESAFVAEGVRLLEESLNSPLKPSQILFSSKLSDRGKLLVEELSQKAEFVEEVPDHLLQTISDTETSQGVLAVFPYTPLPLPVKVDFLLVLDQIRDPGNLGTILRSAIAAQADAVLITPGTVDPFSPKVLRSGMGAHFRLPIRKMRPTEIQAYCAENRITSLATDVNEGQSCWQTDMRRPCAIVIGSEANGVSPEILSISDERIHIPMPGTSESLNAAIAASILLFEIVRQRSS